MPETKTVTLIRPIEHHNATITQVQLREPSGGLYARLGDPRVLVRTKEGGYYVDQPEVIRAYLDKIIDHQDGAVLLGLMGMSDVMMIREELFGFFLAAEGTIIARRGSGSPSS